LQDEKNYGFIVAEFTALTSVFIEVKIDLVV